MASSSDLAAANEILETMKESRVPNDLVDRPVVAVSELEANMEDALQPYVQGGFRGIIASRYIAGAVVLRTIGGFLFGYDQGVLSVILVMENFLVDFPRVGPNFGSLWKGTLTATIDLGALFGAFNQSWISDK